jgi:hypothetical protein
VLQNDPHALACRSKWENLKNFETLGIAKRILYDYLPETSLGKQQSKRFCDFYESDFIGR